MSETASVAAIPERVSSQDSFLPQVVRVAWLSVGLGIAFEILLLVLAALSGTAGESGKPALADLAQKISWSFLVCVGLAFGTAARKLRETVMGGLGLFVAPLAFIAAKAIHKGLGQALGTIARALTTPLQAQHQACLARTGLATPRGWRERLDRRLLGFALGNPLD